MGWARWAVSSSRATAAAGAGRTGAPGPLREEIIVIGVGAGPRAGPGRPRRRPGCRAAASIAGAGTQAG